MEAKHFLLNTENDTLIISRGVKKVQFVYTFN